jgi:hypothetical protein
MAVGVVVLGWVCLMIGLGIIGPAVSGLASGFGNMLGSLTHLAGSPSPSASGAITEAPVIEPPDATTNSASVDLTVRIPQSVVGAAGYTLRLYAALPDAQPVVVKESPVGGVSTPVIQGVPLAKGANTLTATIVSADGTEGPASKPVTVTLDVSKPKVTISTPKKDASVTTDSITVKGKTQAGSDILIRNDNNGATANDSADAQGVFSAKIAIAAGVNNITVTVTDPAGNGNTATVTVTKGTGKLKAELIGTIYRFTIAKLPQNAKFTVTVTGADGKPVAGATALFTVSVPGLAAIVSSQVTTDANGTAQFSTTIPKGAMAGQGVADVLVTLKNGKTITARAALSVK